MIDFNDSYTGFHVFTIGLAAVAISRKHAYIVSSCRDSELCKSDEEKYNYFFGVYQLNGLFSAILLLIHNADSTITQTDGRLLNTAIMGSSIHETLISLQLGLMFGGYLLFLYLYGPIRGALGFLARR